MRIPIPDYSETSLLSLDLTTLEEIQKDLLLLMSSLGKTSQELDAYVSILSLEISGKYDKALATQAKEENSWDVQKSKASVQVFNARFKLQPFINLQAGFSALQASAKDLNFHLTQKVNTINAVLKSLRY